ncbi:TPA: 50S ribosomal protein L24 [Candidatus Woesearchaeota archaeon]|nr:50S ribosomal protein L24P [uncultured archaeon]MBS3115348.1 50S ribosomal protein L24 [Candidatus Woesearchaeota archaeon]HIH39178.1 50S ribosomal protein L24 [Candidatus Woesearchaeota archaeon]
MNEFSNAWKSSSNPGKQRKYRFNAPLHKKRKFLSARLSKDLTKKHSTRNIPLRKGDRVKVVRGSYKGTLGKVDRINLKRERIFVEGTDRTKRDGTKSLYPIHPSNVIIYDLVLDDRMRKQMLERKVKK